MNRVFIVSDEYTPTECAVLEEVLGAKLDEHKALRARYVRPSVNAEMAAQILYRTVMRADRESAEEEAEVTHAQVDAEADARLAEYYRKHPHMRPGLDEHDYPQDDSDRQPFERTTTYPWGER